VLLRLAIASYSAPSRLALDAHDSPRKAQFVTFRGIRFLVIFTWVEWFSVQGSGLKHPNPAAKRDHQKENTLIGANVKIHPMGERGESESCLKRHE
jgi:hypothetical protein